MHSSDACSHSSSQSCSLEHTGGGVFASIADPPWETRACFPISFKPSHPQDAPAASGCTRLFLGSQEGLMRLKLLTSAKFAENFPKVTCSLE